jgi:seryl-tRNA synthetase
MLDIDLFRVDRGGNPDIVRESQRRRHKDVSLVDKVIELDTEWRSTRGGLDNAKKVLNQVQKKIGEFMKKKESPPPELMKEKQDADAEITKLEAKEKELIEARDTTCVGNLVHEDAPLVAAPPAQRGLPADTLRRCLMASGLAEPVASGTVPSRSWRAVGDGLLLQQQWLSHALAFVAARGFELLHAPLQPCADRLDKLDKLRRGRGEQGTGVAVLATRLATDPLGALHACRCADGPLPLMAWIAPDCH